MATEHVDEIKKALTNSTLVIGTDVVLKKLKNAEIKHVFIASNTPEITRNDLAHFAKLSNATVTYLEETNEDLKEICKKRFNISVVALTQ